MLTAKPTLLESGGQVDLWAGWALTLPPAYYQRNDGGSWSAWGADWAVDVHIIEVGARNDGKVPSTTSLLGPECAPNIAGEGWIGIVEVRMEEDAGRMVYRLAGTLASSSSVMSLWVSYFEERQQAMAEAMLREAVHCV